MVAVDYHHWIVLSALQSFEWYTLSVLDTWPQKCSDSSLNWGWEVEIPEPWVWLDTPYKSQLHWWYRIRLLWGMHIFFIKSIKNSSIPHTLRDMVAWWVRHLTSMPRGVGLNPVQDRLHSNTLFFKCFATFWKYFILRPLGQGQWPRVMKLWTGVWSN